MQTAGPMVALRFPCLSVCLCVRTYLVCNILRQTLLCNCIVRITAFGGL